MQPQIVTKAGGRSRNDRIGYSFRPEKVHRNHSDFESLLKASIKKARRSA